MIRNSTNLKIGVLGLPNIGKSQLFNILTNSNVPSENYPFCTISPNEAKAQVPNEKFNSLIKQYTPKSSIPSFLSIIDIAGLVRGASSGQGLGNEFLSNVKNVDGLFHLIRAFKDDNVTHVEDFVDVHRDCDIIMNELRIKDLDFIDKLNLKKISKRECTVVDRIRGLIGNEKSIQFENWSNEEIIFINNLKLLSVKPVVYLLNCGIDDYCNGIDVSFNEKQAILYSGILEEDLSIMDVDERKEYLKHLSGVYKKEIKSAIPGIIKSGYDALGLIDYHTASENIVQSWTIQKGTCAGKAGNAIHSDFEVKFRSCTVNGITMGKDYVVQDGDVMVFNLK